MKICRSSFSVVTVMAMLMTSGLAMAQPGDTELTLELFSPVETARQESVTRAQPPQVASPEQAQLYLVGTSRFGDSYRVRLRTAGDESRTVDYHPGESAAIPGYPGFRIESVDARSVVITRPGNSPCVASVEQGVSCLPDGNRASLALRTAEPVTPAVESDERELRRRGQRGAPAAADNGGENESDNPFARALRAARANNDGDAAVERANAERFERRTVIDAADLPEGYRVVRTPFGDRIVRE